jgi:thioredoxin 1
MAVIKTTDADFVSALQNNPASIVKYYADWCGSCKLISPKFRRLSEDEQFAGIQFLEINAEENPDARHRAGVNNLPFFASFRGDQLVQGQATSREESIVELLETLNQ